MADGDDGETAPDPIEELRAQLAQRDLEMAELRGRLSAQTATPPPAPVKVWTRAELENQVALGQMTEEAASQVYEAQIQRRVDETVKSTVDVRSLVDRLDAELTEYETLRPDVLKAGSADRQRVAAEYQYLTRNGSPETKATELAALRAVFGPIAKLKAASAATSRRETHQEGGSGDGGADNADTRQDGSPKGLSARERQFYQRGIDDGRYADWKAVEAELAYANPDLRRKMGAR